eukprot:TRINITY_DN7047_c0_g1_i1.p1 TRINITY_DN7047_c0_g1~~TRINITY_DN7047_c0_g1_i1.p1  ORF type:complete len:516 (-),score=159.31 TRINITY_DN7047_c0_g1_i1:129-1637(-)
MSTSAVPIVTTGSGAPQPRADPAMVSIFEMWKVSADIAEAVRDRKALAPSIKAALEAIANVRKGQRTSIKGDYPRVDRKTNFKPFMKWLTGEGFVEKENLWEVNWDPIMGHGLLASQDIPAGSSVLTVPVEAMMTMKSALSGRTAVMLHKDQLLQSIPSAVLILDLIVEKYNKGSKYEAYIQSLPRYYPTVLFWRPEEFAALEEGSMAIIETAAVLSQALRYYSHMYIRLDKDKPLEMGVIKKSIFTWDIFAWAFSAVESRKNNSVYLPGKDGKNVESLAMVPAFDLINHAPIKKDVNVEAQFNVEKRELQVVSTKAIKKGTEIKMFYGDRPNFSFLAHAGFIVPNNNNNVFLIYMSVRESDRQFAKKKALLEERGLTTSPVFALTAAVPIHPAFLGWLRIAFSSTEAELELAEKAFTDEGISPENDLRVYTMLTLKLTQVKGTFASSLEATEKALESSAHNYILHSIQKCSVTDKKIVDLVLKKASEKKAELKAIVDAKKK